MRPVLQWFSRSLGSTTLDAVDVQVRRARLPFLMVASLIAALFLAPGSNARERHETSWVATWAASPQRAGAPVVFNRQTVRQILHVSLGGHRLRVRLSNAYGDQPLVIGSARVALAGGGAAIVAGSDRQLRFNGSSAITIPAGALVISDPVDLQSPSLGDLVVSLYLPENVSMITEHTESVQTTYVSGTGDYTAAPTFPATTLNAFYVVTGVEVTAPPQARAVVTLGDSLTVGFGSTPDANRRWTDLLAERLQSGPGTKHVAVVNAGVVGNRLLHDFVGTSALARLDRDVLVQSGAQYMIVLEGNADLLIPPLINNPSEVVTIGQILQAYRQLIDRGHALGLSVYGATLNPVEGYPFPGLWTAELEQKRQDINRWIRTSGAFDAVIDFDQVLRDPTNPARLLSRYDSGDHVHPNDLGYQAMADAVNLSLFRGVDQD
jgi:lysophospholipase L1-like esterase